MDQQSSFTRIVSHCSPDYHDDGIVLLDDLRRLGIGDEALYLSDNAMLLFVRAGEMRISIDGEEMAVTPRHVLFCRPGNAVGRLEASEDFSGHALVLSMRLGQRILSFAGNIWRYVMHAMRHPVLTLPEDSHELLRTYYSLLRQEVGRRDNAFYNEVVASIIVAMVCSLLHSVIASERQEVEGGEEQEGSPQALALFQRFMRILNNERCVDRKIDYYAQRLCVTPKYLSAVCKRVSQRTAHQWICDAVVNGIRQQLRYSTLSIKEIAVEYGFPNISFFSKYVKEHLGMSPHAFRAQQS